MTSLVSRGRFITFEGGEGSGKSLQSKRLAGRLHEHGFRVTLTREPGGTPAAEVIRNLLVTGEPGRWTAESEALLFSAARADHLDRLIRPRLAAGDWVICDRFVDSTRVYQGAGGALVAEYVETLAKLVVRKDWPDLTIVLDLDVDLGLARAKARGGAETRFEQFDRAFHERLRRAYQAIAAADPARCALVDGGKDEDAVAVSIWQALTRRFPELPNMS